MYEALCDPKTWLFALFSAMAMVPTSLFYQHQIIVSSFGFSPIQVTLLGCVNGIIAITTYLTGVWLVGRFHNSRCYVAVIYLIPNIIAVFNMNLLPWSSKIGLLFSQWMASNYFFPAK